LLVLLSKLFRRKVVACRQMFWTRLLCGEAKSWDCEGQAKISVCHEMWRKSDPTAKTSGQLQLRDVAMKALDAVHIHKNAW
jgi:hypothetical protein